MNTSGTYGAVDVTVATIIEHAVRKCGKLPSTVSGELLLSAQRNLFFLLSGLANAGLSLFCQTKQVLACVPGQVVYPLQAGAVDVLNVLSRTSVVVPGVAIAGDGWQGAGLAEATVIGSCSVDFSSDVDASFAAEYSQDLVTWAAAATMHLTGPAGTLFYTDIELAPAAQFWRLRAIDGSLPQVNDLAWHNGFVELPLTPFNRDEYQLIPNKLNAGSRPLQYWYDKQISPRLSIWPLASDAQQQLVVWMQRHIQDPGALSGALAVPQRWLEAVIYQLAVRVCEELPAQEVPAGRLEYLNAKADSETAKAEDGESDGSAISITPAFQGYTRG